MKTILQRGVSEIGWVNQLFIFKNALQSMWMAWERIFIWSSRFRGSHTFRFEICTVMIKKHRGAPIICADSTVISHGDWIGELHLDNAEILSLIRTEGPDLAALKIARLGRRSMKLISRAYTDQSEFNEVRALVGITLLHRGLTHGLGFEMQTMKQGLLRRLTTSYLRLLLSVLHPEGKNRIGRRREQLIPMKLVHTRASLARRFPSPVQETVMEQAR